MREEQENFTHDTDLNLKLKSFKVTNNEVASIQNAEKYHEFVPHELPIFDALISRTIAFERRESPPDNRERMSLGGSSSMGELQWENEIINDEFNGNEHNGNELEWDHYEEETMAFHNEAEQLIYEIEELTQTSINELRQ